MGLVMQREETVATDQADRVPVVDLAGLFNGQEGEVLAVGRRLVEVCGEPGSFYVVNHGIDSSVVERAFSASQAFFAEPLDAKMEVHALKCPPFRGYVRMQERKRGSGTLADDPMAGDFKENYDIGPDLPDSDPAVRPGNPFYGPNVWPAQPGRFRPDIEAFDAALKDLGRRLMVAVELGLGAPAGMLSGSFDRPLTRMKLIHYPPAPNADGPAPEGVGAHSDFSCLTILAQDNVGGLEIFDKKGRPVAAPPLPGSLFINVGDQLSRWTNGQFWPTVHRVINTARTDRYSIAFFLHPNFDTEIRALPQCASNGQPVPEPILAGEDLLDRLGGKHDKAPPAAA